MVLEAVIVLLKAGFIITVALTFGAVLTWVERKQSAVMQDRIGANRAAILGLRVIGLFHILSDAIKMFTKEEFTPARGDKFLHTLAPALSIFFALMTFAAIPFGDTLRVGNRVIDLQVANLNAAVLFVFAMVSLGVYGVVLGGWASENNYSFLGGMRASAQMISYEVTLGVSVIGALLIYGTLNLQEMVRYQGHMYAGWIPRWGILLQPLGFLLFLVAGIAETKRVPFDLPEGESEIVGYWVEYSSMKWGMYMFTDFIEMTLLSAMASTLFLGGWQVPWLMPDGFHFPWATVPLPHLAVVVLQVGAFLLKVSFLLWLQMLIRWTLPRVRYDQLMAITWKYLLPLSLLNVILTAAVLLVLR
ncbi:MAG: NADH-quinone oxidoreductase subunit H [candidate division KSB1 bacterium]|nr:NADH-quinone oxidoreductase subunit H [candidate division KSB1 bacterium]